MLLLATLIACAPNGEPTDLDAWLDPRLEADGAPPPPIDGAAVVINEIQASNKSTWQSSDWQFPDWVELYNRGTEPAELRDLQLIDHGGNTWRGPDDGEIAPGERVFLAEFGVDDDFNLPFALGDNTGESLYLSYRGAVADVVAVGDLGDDLSLARFPDGGDWQPTARPTPGFANGNEPSETLDPTSEMYKAYVMHRMEVHVDAGLWNQIDSRVPVECSLTIDGIYFRRATLKNSGQGSSDSINGKPRLKFNLDAFETDREFRGVDNFELHNGKTADSTRGRDWASYRYANLAGIAGSRVGFTHLTINGMNYGLYVMVENQDDKFIKARWPEAPDRGMIFEGGDFGSGVQSFEYETGPVPADPNSTAAMEAANTIVSGPSTDEAVARLWQYVDKDLLLDYIALEGISNDWDGYHSPHNYRWFVDGVTHRTQLVPAGIEITWQGEPELWASNGNLSSFCMANQGCKREYAEHVLAMADLVDDSNLAQDYSDLERWLLPYIEADPRKFEDMATVRGVIANSTAHLRSNPRTARQDVYAVFPELHP